MSEATLNTDREIWRRVPGDYYSPSVHVTADGGIGMNVGGTVIVMDIEDWFLHAVEANKRYDAENPPLPTRWFRPYFSEWLVQRFFGGGWFFVALAFAAVAWSLW